MDLVKLNDPPASRDGILSLQDSIADLPNQIDCESLNTHHFAPGIYGRQMDIPAGAVIVGKIHKHAHINVITKGTIKVVTEFGNDVYIAPKIWVSEPGTKRAVYALEDTQWLTIHANETNSQDLSELERQVIAPCFDDLDMFLEKKS